MRDTVLKFEARRVGEEIVLHGIDQERTMRWTFYDIGADHFLWRNETEQSDGSWRVQQRFSAARMLF